MDQWVAAEKAAGRRIGFTCGSFDLLHAGHVQYLGTARELCDRLIVAVNSDASVSRYKNPTAADCSRSASGCTWWRVWHRSTW